MSELIIREIIESDLENGFLESLDNLRQASNLEHNYAKGILKGILENVVDKPIQTINESPKKQIRPAATKKTSFYYIST